MRSAITLSTALLLLGLAAPAVAQVPADIGSAPGVETYDRDDGVWVRRHLTVSLGADGRVVREVEEALKPLTGNPMRNDMLDPRIDWNDTRSSLEVLEAVTWMVDGTEVRALDNSFVPNTAGALQWAVPYAGVRQLTVAHVGVEHGSTSLLHYRVTDRGALGMPLWGQQTLADYLPIVSQRVTLEAPEGSPLHWGVLYGSAQPQASTQGDMQRLVFQDVGVEGLVLAENHGRLGVPRLVWSTARDWKQARSFLEAQVEPSVAADGYVRGKLDEVLDGSLTEAERIARIHAFVVDGVRSIHWDPADFGYATRSAPEVLNSSVGHALDKAVLLVTMLRASGLDAHVALAASERAWLPQVPSPAPFDQVWVRVGAGGHAVWLDPTASLEAHNRFHLAGHAVLVLDGESVQPDVLAELEPAKNRAVLRTRVELTDGEDSLAVQGRADLDLGGLYNPVVTFDRSKDKLSGVCDQLSGTFGGGTHTTYVGMRSGFFLAVGADFEGGSIDVPDSGLVRIDLPRVPSAVTGASVESWRLVRTLPIELAAPAREQVVLELVVPEGWELAHQPQPVELDNGIGSFSRSVVDDGEGTITLRSNLELRQVLVPPEAWPDLRILLNEVEATAGTALLLRRAEESE